MKKMSINIQAKTALSILAAVVLVVFIASRTLNSVYLTHTAVSMFWGVLVTVIIVTVLINLPRIMRSMR